MRNSGERQIKLAYIVTESGCLDPTAGAFQHISMGLRELGNNVEVLPFLPKHQVRSCTGSKGVKCEARAGRLSRTSLWGAMRDVRDFVSNVKYGWKVARAVKAAGCDAAYIRVQALQPISLFLKFFRIPVFLESNGLQFKSRKCRFNSALSCLYKPFERLIYSKGDHVFFVGSYGQYWQLSSQNWTEVENGVEPEMFCERDAPPLSGSPIKVVLLARLVAHHKGSVLVDAIKSKEPSVVKSLELHLIGSGFEEVESGLGQILPVVNHGFVGRDKIGQLLREMDVGVIPDCPPYGSQMKLIDYAAAGCVVLAPDVPHLINFYKNKGIVFFAREDSDALSNAFSNILSDKSRAYRQAEQLKKCIVQHYTWSTIFEAKWQLIAKHLGVDA